MRRLALLALTLFASSCAQTAEQTAAMVRSVTYPPDFRYIPKESVESAMWQMAAAVRDLDAALRDDTIREPRKQQRVLGLLDQLQSTSNRLESAERPSNHPLLDRNAPRLSEDIQAARIAASGTPPRYTLAGAVSGACIYCHSAPPIPH
jgi:PBP1b-binding outer membrane lipoprotein LpoB